ncbi:MAG: hypothetical protein HZB91_06190 [Elusimicrobia bacterium]|nr:hypothetical protein [Elusimicrobiota bacterium]
MTRKTAGNVRLLLLEFLCHRDDRSETSMFYPFLKGIARDCGVPSLWLFFVGTPRFCWARPTGRTLRAHIPEEDIARLRAHLKRFRPTHIVCNELPSRELRAAIEAAGSFKFLVMPCESDTEALAWGEHMAEMDPHLALVSARREDRSHIHRPAWFADWLGGAKHPREAEHILDSTQPDFSAVQANDGENFSPGFPLILVGGQSCRGRPRVAGNPRFRHLAGAADFHPGCSFCGGADEDDLLSGHRLDSLALAEAQLRILGSIDPELSRSRGTYMVHDLGLFMRIDEFFKMVRKNKFKPAKFIFCPRIDDVLSARERVDSILPLAAEGGHRIGFDIMGIENFCPKTMELYNKNISVAQADEMVSVMNRWHEEWPQVFDPFHGGKDWLMLLFTPWTTLPELRLNYDEAARRGFDSAQFWICTSLMLRKGSALAALAADEGGIITPEFEDRGLMFFPTCGMQAMWGSLPWRFKDAKVADFYRILIRIYAALERPESRPLFGDDPEFDLFSRIYCGMSSEPGKPLLRPAWSLLAVARTLLELIETATAPWSREALLREAVARVKKTAPAPVQEKKDEENGPRKMPPLAPLERTVIDEVGRLLEGGKSKALGAITIESAGAASPVDRSIRLDLLIDGRALSIALFASDYPGRFFFRSGSFKVIYLKDGPAWREKKLREVTERLRLLVALIGRRLEALRAGRGKPDT